VLAIAAIAAQALDLFSMRWETEVNPVVLALGPLAIVLKSVIVVGLGALAIYMPGRLTTSVLALALGAGTIGALSNGVLS